MGGRHISQMWTGTPFFALLTRPVMGVSLTGSSDPLVLGGIGLMGWFGGPRAPLFPPMDDDDA